MKKVSLICIGLVWMSALIILIMAITGLWSNHVFKEHAFIIAIGFISITGLLKPIYNLVIKIESN